MIISGNWASRAALLCALFSTVPPVSSSVPAGIDLRKLLDRACDLLVNEGRLQSRQWLRLHGDGRQAAATPDIALVEIILELGKLARGTEAPVGVGIWRLRNASTLDALAALGPRHDIDQIDRVAKLGDRRAAEHAIERLGELFGA